MTTPLETIWSVNGPVLLLYIAAAALFVAVREATGRLGIGSSTAKPLHPAAAFLLTFVANVLAVGTVVILGRAFKTGTRPSMLAVPLALVAARYVQLLARQNDKASPAAGLLGTLAGAAVGAWKLMRDTFSAEAAKHAVVSGEVRTVSVTEVLKDKGDWAVSVQLAVYYVAALAIFFGLHALLKSACAKLTSGPDGKGGGRALAALLLAFALNFAGVAALVFLAKLGQVQLRLAMIFVSVFVVAEAYVKALRADPDRKRAHWSGLIGSLSGIAAGTFVLLRTAPLH